MPEYCTCGAELPPDARFCHKCGRPLRDEPVSEPEIIPPPPPLPPVAAPPINFGNPLAVRLAFLAALVACLFTFVQFLGCPLWLFGSGLMAAVWYRRRSREPLSVENGARMGWITGLFSFMIFTVLFTFSFVTAIRSGVFERGMREQIRNLPFGQANADKVLEMLRSPMGMALNLALSLLVMFVIFAVFAALGGALGAKLAQRRA